MQNMTAAVVSLILKEQYFHAMTEAMSKSKAKTRATSNYIASLLIESSSAIKVFL